jgi:hypothetical protein
MLVTIALQGNRPNLSRGEAVLDVKALLRPYLWALS